MANDDKYPGSSGRRRFVKGVVGSAALAGVGTSAGAVINTTTNPTGAGGGAIEYFGVENTAGPAPRAMPQIPVRIDGDGFLQGLWPEVEEVEEGGQTFQVARTELPAPGGGTIVYSNEWFQYCGVQTYPGVQPDADQDQYFRYANNPPYTWQQENVNAGDRVHVDDFQDYQDWENDIGRGGVGKPAFATWRSEGVPGSATMPVQLIRSESVETLAPDNPWLEASTREGFIAFLDKCTHFCCVPGFKSFTDSAKFEAEDLVYCQCHQSVYDPFSLVRRSFVALPRPEDD
jgi:Rieske Fe-S protein